MASLKDGFGSMVLHCGPLTQFCAEQVGPLSKLTNQGGPWAPSVAICQLGHKIPGLPSCGLSRWHFGTVHPRSR
eukprot:4771755-Karenia_brevis.AAC.1